MDETKDCIDREKAIRICERLRDKTDNDDMAFALDWAIQSINNIPAVDVPSVVNCRDCAHARFYTNKIVCGYWSELTYAAIVGENDFCSYGEKRCNDGAT